MEDFWYGFNESLIILAFTLCGAIIMAVGALFLLIPMIISDVTNTRWWLLLYFVYPAIIAPVCGLITYIKGR